MAEIVAGRAYARAYRTPSRADQQEFLVSAVEQSGGTVLYASDPKESPVYLGILTPSEERIGVLAYAFRANHRKIKNRPDDEHRLQVKYGSEPWPDEYPIGLDVATVDTTLVVAVHIDANLFVGLDANLYNPLPMGISVEFKQDSVDEALRTGWHVFERDNTSGTRRNTPRAPSGLETVVLFSPDRFLDYVRLERTATDLGLDSALRFEAAVRAAPPSEATAGAAASIHDLEIQYGMSAPEILDMISSSPRTGMAVRGRVAEFHLAKILEQDTEVTTVVQLERDGQHDFDVTMKNAEAVRVECKNASPKRYANGDIKVEVQKTRATQGDPAGRLYRIDQFDVVAACLKGPTGEWIFRYRLTALLEESDKHPGRLAPLQRVTDDWASTLQEAL